MLRVVKTVRHKARAARELAREGFSFARGFRDLRRTQMTPEASYGSFRRLYCHTNGRLNDAVSFVLSLAHPPTELPQTESVLGNLSSESIARIVRDIEANGFHVFDRVLPAEITESLRRFAQSVPCKPLGYKESEGKADELPLYGHHADESPIYEITANFLQNVAVQQLVMDLGFPRVAQAYLRCSPILDVPVMWWSRARGGPSSEAGQLYHYDMDRIKSLKFFFYLTDVTPESGPQCYIRGSSRRKPRAILRDGRIPDEEIRRHYPAEAFAEICGGTGTIIAGDTRTWHKGQALIRGERLVLQFEFANSMYGRNHPKLPVPKDASPAFHEFVHSHRRLVQGITNI